MAERYIPDHRRTQFKAKNTFKPEELRRRREEQAVEIRKAKREENLAKRRGITARDGSQTSAPGAALGASIDSDDEGGSIESQVRLTARNSSCSCSGMLAVLLDMSSMREPSCLPSILVLIRAKSLLTALTFIVRCGLKEATANALLRYS